MPIKCLICLIIFTAGASALAENPDPTVREEHKIVVNGIEEIWRLEWVDPTTPMCSPGEPDVWMTCPCSGFAFGESGKLVLVRKRPGQEDERLDLTRLFELGFDEPTDSNNGPARAILRRWEVDEKDMDDSKSPDFAAKVRARPLATVMSFGDYDHDGQAAEFLLQVGTLPCGKQMNVAIGISRDKPNLHVFGTAEHPEKPLVLQAWEWASLLRTEKPIKLVDWKCGDHGSDKETELELSVDAKGIHATRLEYNCDQKGRRGDLARKETL